MKLRKTILCSTAFALSFPGAAMAQSGAAANSPADAPPAAGDEADTIVVTAQFREQRSAGHAARHHRDQCRNA